MPLFAFRASRRSLFASGACLLALALHAANPASIDPTLLENAYALDAAPAGTRDAVGAARLYAQAASAGDAFAHLRLGQLYETGDGVTQDYVTARAHYQAATDLGLAAARVPLAVCHLEGWGGPADRDAFVREIRLAAEAGEAPAQRILGSLLATGLMVPKDPAASIVWLERAAGAKDAVAQHHLGLVAENAHRFVTERNLEIARTWYQRSAENEYLTGLRAMARTFIDNGRDTPDWTTARQWLALADEAGDSEAPFILALAEVLQPDSTAPDEARALAWLRTAASRSNFRALEVLDAFSAGQTLRQALEYVLSEAAEDRYVRRLRQNVGEGPDRPPVPVRVVSPVYPLTFRMTGVEGKVTARFVVDVSGRVRNIVIVAASHPVLAERVTLALTQWRFDPARKDGHAVNTEAQLDFPFYLSEETPSGVDGLLAMARDKAMLLGDEFEAYTKDLRMARAISPAPTLQHGEGAPGERRYAIVVLALDATGTPLRGRILEAEPAALGEEMLTAALTMRFQPRIVEGKAVPSNALLPYFSQAMTLGPLTP